MEDVVADEVEAGQVRDRSADPIGEVGSIR
jgi:hypothetical protein